MVAIGLGFAAVSALLHCYIFFLESFAWTAPRTRATFGTTEETAETTRPLAFNQGFYNLFLALAVFVGLALFGSQRAVGATLILTGAGSMLAAAMVLLLSDRSKARAAVVQGGAPLLSVLLLTVDLVS